MENADKYDSEITVEDGEDFRGAEALGIKTIALEQYRRCCVEGSKEMRNGGIVNKLIRGVIVPVEVPDQREIFVNCVKLLEIILAPELFQKKADERLKKIHALDKKIDELKKSSKNAYAELIVVHDRRKRCKPESYDPKSFSDDTRQINDETDSKMVNLFQEKLIILSQQLSELNYFDEGSAGSF